MSSLRTNTIANYIGRCWGALSVFLFVPFYLEFLGIEAYGIVGFFTVLQGILVLADMGLTSTLTREVARLSGIGDGDSAREMRTLVRTIERVYLLIAVSIAGVVFALAGPIATHWLNPKTLSVAVIQQAIGLMGLAIAFQLPAMMYQGGLLGLQRQVLANAILVFVGLLRGVGSVVILWKVSPTLQAFFLWQVFTTVLLLCLERMFLWRSLPAINGACGFDGRVLRRIGPYALGMMGISLNAIILTQADKWIISKLLSVEMLGYYTLAGSLSSVPMMLAGPIASAVFPRLTELVGAGDYHGLTRLYHRTSELVAISIFPAGLTMALFAGDCIFAWTGSAATARHAGLVGSFLIGGQIMQAITVVPFYLALAHGDTRLNLQIGMASVILITPLLIYLILHYGVAGGGASWLIMNLCTVPFYMSLLHRRFLPGELRSWLLCDVGRPLLAVVPVVLVSRWFVPSTSSRLLTFGLIGLVWCVATAAAVVAVPRVRSDVVRRTTKMLGVSYGW